MDAKVIVMDETAELIRMKQNHTMILKKTKLRPSNNPIV